MVPLLDEFSRVAPTQLRVVDEVLGGTWDALLSGRALKGGRGRRVPAAVGLAVSLATWQRLTREEGLDDSDAVKLMVRAIEAP